VEQLLQALFAFTDPVHDGGQLLPAFGRGSHEDVNALLLVALVFQPHVPIDADELVVDVPLTGEAAAAPPLGLLAPLFHEANDDVEAESLGIRAE